MTDILAEICEVKRAHIAGSKKLMSLAELEQQAKAQSAPRGFQQALAAKTAARQTALVTEIKKASPSAGVIRADFHPVTLAAAYANAGATCLSVLTDKPYFQGDDAFVSQVRAACTLPVLRKDFMLDPYQITESRALGADCILLILAVLSDAQAQELEQAALAQGMDVLVEVHDQAEMERTHALKSRLIGINNRNLKTLAVDLDTSLRLAPLAPEGSTLVCESGIGSHGDILRMQQSGLFAFLVGESLMRQPELELATRTLLGAA